MENILGYICSRLHADEYAIKRLLASNNTLLIICALTGVNVIFLTMRMDIQSKRINELAAEIEEFKRTKGE